jgi:hypothetical protein
MTARLRVSPRVLVSVSDQAAAFFRTIGGGRVHRATATAETIEVVRTLLG